MAYSYITKENLLHLKNKIVALIPTKTSQLQNDSGFLTTHQDISGKADKATTLSGYGITDAYTKTEVDSKVSNVTVDLSAYSTTSQVQAMIDTALAVDKRTEV